MAGSGQGIVVSIQAKIEGWQEQLKNIQNALKNLRIDSGLTKSLTKDLQQVQSIINNLGKNINQRLTSDSQITAFTDKMRQVELLFNTIGQSMSQINFADLNVDYITTNFKDLLTTIDEAKSALATGFDESFSEAVQGSDRLQTILSRLKIDPKNMNVDELKSALQTTSEDLTKSLSAAEKKLDDLYKKQAQITAESKSIKNSELYNSNSKDMASTLSFGLQGTTQEVNHEAIEKYVNNITSKLDELGPKVQEKRAEIDSALKNLLSVETVEEVDERVEQLRAVFDKTGALAKIGLTKQNISNVKDSFINQIIPSREEIDAAVIQLKERLVNVFNITDTSLITKAGNTAEKFIREGKWDQLPDELEKIINEAKSRMSTTLTVNDNYSKELAQQIRAQLSEVFTLGNRVADTNEAGSIIQSIIEGQVQQAIEPLRQRIEELEQLLNLKGTEGFKDLGKNLQNKSTNGLNEATAAAKQYVSALEDVQTREKLVGKLEGIAQRWFSVYAVVRLVSNAIRSMKENVNALDKTMTEIAIVTDMSQSDLWKQMPDYTQMARKYGSSIQGTYEVSQLYYQQGLQRDDVMALTEETLKMARISGLQYSEATNYMTNAVRSFKIELQDASTVVDVYSALAASSASSTAELASAMSKTASSAAAVGSSFEATSAMLAVMIETTRESPENIGSALKSIISRYGELKENKVGIDEEGEAYSLNKVDTALQSVGISIHDAEGRFRDFDEVIMELAEHWDTIDVNTQRYIATVMAGNRQQSRFLALVSNGERLQELTSTAENSEDAATLQVLKTMDSIEYKSQQLQTSLQSLYTNSGIENVFKGLLDVTNNIVETFGSMPTILSLPIPAIISLGTTFLSVANIVMTGLHALRAKFTAQREALFAEETAASAAADDQQVAHHGTAENQKSQQTQDGVNQRNGYRSSETNNAKNSKITTRGSKLALAGNILGSGLQLASAQIGDRGDTNRAIKGVTGILGGTIQDAALGYQIAGPWGALGGGVLGLLTSVFNNIQYFIQDTAARAARLKQEAEQDATAAKTSEATARSKEKEISELEKLAQKRYESAEAEKAFIEASNQAAESMPELIDHFDNEGNAILDLTNAYEALKAAREAANEAGRTSAESAGEAAAAATQAAQEVYEKAWSTNLLKPVDAEKIDPLIRETLPELVGSGVSFYNAGIDDVAGAMVGHSNQLAFDDLLTTEGDELVQLTNLLSDGDISSIYQLLEDDYTGIIEGWNDSLDVLKDYLGEDSGEVQLFDYLINSVIDSYNTTKKLEGDFIKAQSQESNTYKTELSKLISQDLTSKKLSATYNNDAEAQAIQNRIDNFSNANAMLTDFIYGSFMSSTEGEEESVRKSHWHSVVKNLGKGNEYDFLVPAYEKLLSIPEDSLEELDQLYESQGNLRKDQFISQLKSLIPNQTEAFYNYLTNYYTKAFSETDWETSLESFDKKGYTFKPDDFLTSFYGPEELRRIINSYESLNKMYINGNITQNQGTILSDTYNSLLAAAAETGNEAQQAILTNLQFTTESINAAIEEFSTNPELAANSDIIIPYLQKLLLQIPINVNTAIESYINDSTTMMEGYTKDLSKATKGMDFKAANELASSLNIDTSAKYFDIKDGALFLKDLSLIDKHYFGEGGVLSQISDRMENMHTALSAYDPTTWSKGATISNDEIEISANELSSVIEAFKESDMEWEDFLQNYFVDRIKEIESLPQELKASIKLKDAISKGNIMDMVSASVSELGSNFTWAIANELLSSLSSGDFTNILSNSEISDEFKKAIPQLKESYDAANKNVIDSVLNVNQGKKYIEQNDYNKELLSVLQGQGFANVFQTLEDGTIQWVIDTSLENINDIVSFLKSEEGILAVGGVENARKHIATLHKTQYDNSIDGIIAQMIKNVDSISEETKLAFDALNTGLTLHNNEDGTFSTTANKLLSLVNNGIISVNNNTQKLIIDAVNKSFDDARTSLTNATKLVTTGTTSEAEMQKWVEDIVELGIFDSASREDIFDYNSLLSSWTLKPEVLQMYAQKQIQQYGLQGQEAVQFINDQVLKPIASTVDIMGFITSQNNIKGSISYSQLETSLTNYYAALGQSTNPADYIDEAKRLISSGNWSETVEEMSERLAEEAAEHNKYILGMTVEEAIETIRSGGSKAVMLAQKIVEDAGKELTAEEMQQYYSPLVQKYAGMAEQVANLVVGQYVGEGDFREILEAAGIVDVSTGLVQSVENMAEAYKEIYIAMKNTSQATTTQLNSLYAQYLTSSEQGEIDAISTLSDAMSMTYDSLGNILAQYATDQFKSLENTMLMPEVLGLEKIGNGKVRIANFEQFASQMNWEVGSEEYINALKTYNDSWIELQSKTAKNVTDQMKTLISSQVGDKINITYIKDALNLTEEEISQYFGKVGIEVSDGVLQIINSAAIPNVVQELLGKVKETQSILPEQFAELQDAVVSALKSITDAIKNGISGTLSHVDFADLQNWADNLGLGKLDFSETAEGVQLTTEAVNKLYVALKKINPQGAKTLLSTIQDSKDSYSDYMSVLSEISQTTSELNSAYNAQNKMQGDTSGIASRTNALEEQLTVLQDLASTLTTTPDAWKFMDNDLPDGIQSVVNLWENGSSAITSLKDAATNGYIAVEDWYNIVTTASALAEAAGQEFSVKGKTAAELINEGLQNIKVVSGKAQVDLSNTGMDFTSGIDDLKSNLTSGINELASAQIEILDAEIAVFEVLAAMEALGDVDLDMDGISFEIEDMFSFDDAGNIIGFSDVFTTYKDTFIQLCEDSEVLKTAAQKFYINGTNFYDLMKSDWAVWEQTGFTAEAMQQLFSRLNTIDWSEDLSQIGSQLLGVFSDLNLNLTVDTENGFISITPTGEWITIDLSDEEVQKQATSALKNSGITGENLKEKVREAWEIYTSPTKWNDEELSWTQKCSIAATVAVATGELTFKTDDKGNTYGLYNGKKFYGSTDHIYQAVAEAMMLEDEGANIEVSGTTSTTVTGTKKVGNLVMKLAFDNNGKLLYSAEGYNGGEPTSDKDAIYQWFLEKGQANEDMAGYTYTDSNGVTLTAQYDATLGVSYIVKTKDGETSIQYNDKQYKDYNSFVEGIKFDTMKSKGDWITGKTSSIEVEGQTYQIYSYHKVNDTESIVTFDESTSTWSYEYHGKTFNNLQDYLDYSAAMESGTYNEATDTIKYTVSGQSVDLTYNAETGTLTYECDVGTFGHVTASTESELKHGIATILKLKDSVENESGQSATTTTIEYAGSTLIVKKSVTGQIEYEFKDQNGNDITDESITKQFEDAYSTSGTTVETETPQPVTITASSVVITLGENATATLDSSGENATIPKIQTADGTVIELEAQKIQLVGENLTTSNESLNLKVDNSTKLNLEMGEEAKVELSNSKVNLGEESSLTLDLSNTKINAINTQEITLDNTPIAKLSDGQNIKVDLSNQTLTSDDTQEVEITAKAKITSYEQDENSNIPSINVNGKITSYEEGTEVSVKTSVIDDLTAFIVAYNDAGADKTKLAQALTGIITAYNDAGADKTQLANDIAGVITAYSEGSEIDTSKLAQTITGYITQYDDSQAPDIVLDELTQFISGINTEGADAALDAWRTAQEAKSISITPQITGTHTDGDTVYLEYAPIEQQKEGGIAPDEITDSTIEIDGDATKALEATEAAKKEIESDNATITIEGDDQATEVGEGAKNDIDAMSATITITADGDALGTVEDISSTLASMNGKTYTTTLNATVNTNEGTKAGATGNVGFARASGTLMGELGPELVVSNGRYFVAGQNGAEFIDLADDAIVFNHLQTEQLLKNGVSNTRGKAITNERNAVSFATGNVSGPAMASASAILAKLKELRSMWSSLLDASVSDLAGSGGSGGGGSSDDSTSARNSYIADVERWYNWLQKIAVLEEKINTEEAKRSKYQADMVARGAEYAKSNLQTLKDLQSEAVTYQALANTQQEFFNLRRSQLNDSAFSRFYTFDENGQLKYNDSDLGYKFLAELMARDDYGEAKYSAEQQYNMLVGAGMEAYMKYDSSGKEITRESASSSKGTDEDTSFYSSSVQAFWDLVDSQKEEMQSLHDSINEYMDSVIEKQTAAYEIIKEIEDNQISVEDKVLGAIEDLRQREIDELQNQRDAIEESANNLINGLTDQLNKEREMYSNQDNQDELSKLQRQLSILQRSGGSASAIASLQKEITQKQRDTYFDAQQQQIDALKEASDNELERLDNQIDLMTESLAYEKEYGLLWNDVYEVMQKTPQEITDFITQHTSDYWGESPTKLTQDTRDVLFEAQQFVAYRDNVTGGIDALVSHFTDEAIQQGAEEEVANSESSGGSSGSGSASGGSGGSDGGSGGSGASNANSSNNNSPSGNSNNDDAIKKAANAVSTIAKITGDTTQKGVENYNKTQAQKAIDLVSSTPYSTVQKSLRENVVATNVAAKKLTEVVTSAASSAISSNLTSKVASVVSNLVSSAKSFITGKKASGGYVNHGIYELGELGTETVLTAEQTKVLRDNILSNRPNSLISLLKSYNEGYDGINDSIKNVSQSNDNSIIIEQATVEMHVAKMNNDYDAQRAGEQALDKMLQIARKTSGQNRIGR